MTKLIKLRELERRLRKAGFEEVDYKKNSNHRKFRHPTGRMVTLPQHPDSDVIHGYMACRALRFIEEVAA
jgi:predicted RNA binding protein YcfA (HicA-like mRNA interferase family)